MSAAILSAEERRAKIEVPVSHPIPSAPAEPSRIIQPGQPAPVPINWTMRTDGATFVIEVTTGPHMTAIALPTEAAGRFARQIQQTIVERRINEQQAQRANGIGGAR